MCSVCVYLFKYSHSVGYNSEAYFETSLILRGNFLNFVLSYLKKGANILTVKGSRMLLKRDIIDNRHFEV